MRRLLAVAALIAAASVPPAGAAPPGAPGAPPAPAFTPRPPASAGLPEAVGAWRLSGAPRVLLPDQLYEYMDGGADLYLGYRFKRLELREYAAPDRDPIVVEAYRMETPDDAYGLLSLDWEGEWVDLAGPDSAGAPPVALLGTGALRLRSGDLYARVLAYRSDAETRQALLTIGRALVAGRPAAPLPAIVRVLEPGLAPRYRPVPQQTRFVRSRIALAQTGGAGGFEEGDTLRLDRSVEAAFASCVPGQEKLCTSPRVLLIRYADPAVAGSVLRDILQGRSAARGPDAHAAASASGRIASGSFPAGGEQIGYAHQGACLGLSFGCADPAAAEDLIAPLVERADQAMPARP